MQILLLGSWLVFALSTTNCGRMVQSCPVTIIGVSELGTKKPPTCLIINFNWQAANLLSGAGKKSGTIFLVDFGLAVTINTNDVHKVSFMHLTVHFFVFLLYSYILSPRQQFCRSTRRTPRKRTMGPLNTCPGTHT
jgi:hypothetical protein